MFDANQFVIGPGFCRAGISPPDAADSHSGLFNNSNLSWVITVTSSSLRLAVEVCIRVRLQPYQIRRKGHGFSRCSLAIPSRNSDPTNIVAGARTFFVTASTCEKRHTLQSDRSTDLFLKVLYEYRAQRRFRLHEFVIMPDHFHVLLTVECGVTIERAVQFIKGGFAFRAGRELGVKAPFWQKGFSEIRILDVTAYQQTARYIRSNPVQAHLVHEAAQYAYSSARAGIELDPPPQWLLPTVAGPKGDQDTAGVGTAKAVP
jgi:putative transposase